MALEHWYQFEYARIPNADADVQNSNICRYDRIPYNAVQVP